MKGIRSIRRNKYLRGLPVLRSIGKSTPEYHVGGVWENRLGFQIYRTAFKNLIANLRRRERPEDIRSHLETLERDGVILIKNWLTEEQFRAVYEEYERAIANAELKPYKGPEEAKLYRVQLPVPQEGDDFPQISKLFGKNSFLNSIAEGVINRKIKKDPTVSLDKYQVLNPKGVDHDIENILHADLHTPTVKMFFTLNNADANNGAFVYAKGSHKLNAARLLHEFDLSIRQAKLRKGSHVSEDLLASRGEEIRNIISPRCYKRMEIDETQICAPPNSLLIANNMGMHRRGEFRTEMPRESLLINYRNSERLFF